VFGITRFFSGSTKRGNSGKGSTGGGSDYSYGSPSKVDSGYSPVKQHHGVWNNYYNYLWLYAAISSPNALSSSVK
jgi:hypothetical protein